MKHLWLFLLIAVIIYPGYSQAENNLRETNPAAPVFDSLVWADEFNVDGPVDTAKWFHQTELPPGGSWHNHEVQHYTNRTDNSYVKGGMLHIVAKRDSFTDQGVTKGFTSARLNSKFAFQYGRVEFRAKMPYGVGTWPAIWMLNRNVKERSGYWGRLGYGTTPWPACGEIDITEHWGTRQNYIQSGTHTPSSHGKTVNHGGQVIPTASTEFHVYAMDWSAEKLVFSVDGNVHYTYDPAVKDPATWPFDACMFLLINVALLPSIEEDFASTELEIDYIRIYQDSTDPETCQD